MNGFFCAINKIPAAQTNEIVSWKQTEDTSADYIHRTHKDTYIHIEQYTSSKFGSEKHFIPQDHFVFVNEGIIQNLQELLQDKHILSTSELIDNYLCNHQENFFENFEGNFCGLLYLPHTKSLTIFNNQTACKKIYFYHQDTLFACATDLKVLCDYLHDKNIELGIHEESAYQLLTAGYLYGNNTLIDGINQIGAGEYLTFAEHQHTISSYFNLNSIEENTDSKDEIIYKLDTLFKRAIKLEFEIDKKHNLTPLTTLSGGLDSRMTALIAHKMGYKNQHLFGLSLKGYADEVIATKIANAYNLTFTPYQLQAESLLAIDQNVAINDGQVLYSMCSHFYSIITQIDSQNTGIIHTGLLGDAVMGSYVSTINNQMCQLNSGLYSTGLLHKSQEDIRRRMARYSTDEHYKFYNRGFNGINSSFAYFDLIGETSSPFLNPVFLKYAHSIPRKYKYKEAIYIDWIRTLHPDIANFVWENIGCKPTNNEWKRKIARIKRAVVKRLPIHTQWKHTMTPEQIWYDHNPTVKMFLDDYFEKNIGIIHISESVRQDMRQLYKVGNYTEKSQVLTLLSAYKLLIPKSK